MRLLCACAGVTDSDPRWERGECCSLAAAACIHGKQIWFFSYFSHWRSQSFSFPTSNNQPRLPLHPEPLKQRDQIKSDAQICLPHFFPYLIWPLPYKPWHVVRLAQAQILSWPESLLCWVMTTDFIRGLFLIELIQLDYINGAVSHVEQTTNWAVLAVDSDCKMCTRQDGLTVNGLQSLRDYMKITVVVVGAQPYSPPKKRKTE